MRYIIIILLLLCGAALNGQTLKGIVVDAMTGRPLYPTTVINQNTQLATYTDEEGNYTLSAHNGDTIIFSFIGYQAARRITPPAIGTATLRVALAPMETQLPAYIVRPGLTPYQEDSAAMHNLYADELSKVIRKPSLDFNNGVGFNGLISSLTHRLSKDYKQGKHFMNTFQELEQDKFIDTRYTPELVHTLTGLSGDTLIAFMNAYPMAYDYARTAGDLEMKMWIRYNYKQYLLKQKAAAQHGRNTQ